MISPPRALVCSTTFSTDGALVLKRLSIGRRYVLASGAGIFVARQGQKALIDGSALSKVQKHLGSDGRGFTIDL
nr:hypothetical protein [Bradyrhizobium genosp. SA-3]